MKRPRHRSADRQGQGLRHVYPRAANPYIIEFCFDVLRTYLPRGVNDLTLELIFGILYRAYHSAREGYACTGCPSRT